MMIVVEILTKTLENSNCKICIFFYFFVCKNKKNSKTTKQDKYSKTKNQKIATKHKQHTNTEK